jgi:hypothetical protein
MTPGISASVGTDSNVFAEDTDPKSDVITTVSPRVQMWLRKRRLVLDLQNSTDAINFSTYNAQGGLSTRNDINLAVPLNRVRLLFSNNFTTTDQRASLEIDARVRRREVTLTGGADVRASSKSFLRFNASTSDTKYDDEAVNRGVFLARSLNRRTRLLTAAWRYQVTGATTLAVSGDIARDQFEDAPERDSRSFRIAPGVEFDSRAIINGRAYVGYRRVDITSGIAPTFSGPVASVELSSTIREATRLSVQVNRDLAYSYDITTPYYLLVGGGGSIGQRLGERWQVTASANRQRLNYQGGNLVGPITPGRANRTDVVSTYGGGVSFLFSETLHFGVTADHSQRHSGLQQRSYDSTRFMAQFGYGS